MDNVFKGIIGVLFTVLVVFLGAFTIISSASARAADDYMQDCMTKMEASNYSEKIINSCKTDATEKGYTLEVNTYKNPTSRRVVYGKATLKYTYQIPFINNQKEKTISMDLR